MRHEGKQESFYSDPHLHPLSAESHLLLTAARKSGAEAAALVRALEAVRVAAAKHWCDFGDCLGEEDRYRVDSLYRVYEALAACEKIMKGTSDVPAPR